MSDWECIAAIAVLGGLTCGLVLLFDRYGQQTVLRFMRQDPERWVYYEDDLSAFRGQTVRIYFGVFNNGWGGITAMWADDVTVDICR